MKNSVLSVLAIILLVIGVVIKFSENSKKKLQEIITIYQDHESYDGNEYPLGLFTKEHFESEANFALDLLNQLENIDTNDLDENNLNVTHNNSGEWFGQQLPMDVIDDFYNSPIKMNKIDKAPNVKFKIGVSKGRPLCEIFGDNSRPIDYNLISKNTEVVCILELVGIKYFKQRII